MGPQGTVLGLAAALLATPACAHGFGQRYDLPIPLSFYLVGAAAAVVVSFVIVGLFVKEAPRAKTYPRVEFRNGRDSDLSHPANQSSVEPFFCEPMSFDQNPPDATTCATPYTGTDKGKLGMATGEGFYKYPAAA